MSLTDQTGQVTARVGSFADGFSCLFKGLRFVYVDHRELARFYIPPMVVLLLLIIGSWAFFAMTVSQVVAWVWTEPDPNAAWGILHFIWQAMAVLLWIIFAVTVALMSAVLFTILAAPFSDLISERIEGIRGTWTPRPFSLGFMFRDIGQTLRFELHRAWLKVAWLLPLFVASLIIPVVGQLVYIGIGGYILSKYTGMDFIDWCAARRGWSWKERLDFAKIHRFALVGLGAAVVLSLMIPLAFVVIWPGAVAGGAILFSSLHQDQPPE